MGACQTENQIQFSRVKQTSAISSQLRVLTPRRLCLAPGSSGRGRCERVQQHPWAVPARGVLRDPRPHWDLVLLTLSDTRAFGEWSVTCKTLKQLAFPRVEILHYFCRKCRCYPYFLGLLVVFPCWKYAPFVKSDSFGACEVGEVWIASHCPTDTLRDNVLQTREGRRRNRTVFLFCIS